MRKYIETWASGGSEVQGGQSKGPIELDPTKDRYFNDARINSRTEKWGEGVLEKERTGGREDHDKGK